MRILLQVASPVGDAIPVHEAIEPGIIDDRAEPLVALLRVGQKISADELVKQLTNRQVEALAGVLF